jgi:hypothetical protein
LTAGLVGERERKEERARDQVVVREVVVLGRGRGQFESRGGGWINGMVEGETDSFAKTPLKAAQAPLARARRSQTGWRRRAVMLVVSFRAAGW